MVVLSSHRVELVPQRTTEAIRRERHLLTAVLVLDVGDGVGRGVEGGLGVAVVLGVEGETVESALDVVPQNCDLAEPAVEGLGGGDVGDIAETEDVIIGLVLQGGGIDVEISSGVGKSRFRENWVGGGGHERVEVAVLPLDQLSSLAVLEDRHILVLNNPRLTLLTSTKVRLFSMLIPWS